MANIRVADYGEYGAHGAGKWIIERTGHDGHGEVPAWDEMGFPYTQL